MSIASTATCAQPAPVALFVSDVHLHESLPRTTQAFFDFLKNHAVHAKQLYLLGDMFEYWAGDDDMSDSYNQQIADALRQVSEAGVALFWMAGNRDFLVSEDFSRATGATLLSDPYVTTIAGISLTLAHGDAQCTDDIAYMGFRAQVRDPDWQQQFLNMPLAQRKAIIAGMRNQSRAAQQTKSIGIMDVNPVAIDSLFSDMATDVMIHGHTHRPARHEYRQPDGAVRLRYVLPDWDCESAMPRGGWISITSDGAIKRHDVSGSELP